MIVDTHCHLNSEEYLNDVNECIKEAVDNNVLKMIVCGYDKLGNKNAIELKKKYPKNLEIALGIHPSDVDSVDLDYLEIIRENKDLIIAVGEIGLDFHYGKENMDKQILFFEEQILLAIELNKPIIIHSREASQKTFDILNKYRGKIKGVMHCYSGSVEMMREFIKLGFYIGIGGVVTFKNSLEVKKCVKDIDLDYLLLETDCPYLTPVPFRGKRNEPKYINYVLKEVAMIRDMKEEDIMKITTSNACKLFNMEEL